MFSTYSEVGIESLLLEIITCKDLLDKVLSGHLCPQERRQLKAKDFNSVFKKAGKGILEK